MIINLDYLNSGGGSGSGVTPSEVNALISSAITQGEYINNAEYISSAKTIVLYQDSTEVATIDATAFIKDGMVDNVYISGTNLVIDFNTDSGKQDIEIPLSDIFDPSNYYTKTDVDAIASGKVDTSALSAYTLQSDFAAHSGNTGIHTTLAEKAVWNGKQDALRFYTEDDETNTSRIVIDDSVNNLYSSLDLDGESIIMEVLTPDFNTKVDIKSAVTINNERVVTEDQLADYQPLLSAGTGIDITNNVISATGGGSVTVDPSLDTGSTNPVANSAITNGFNTYTLKANSEDGIKRYFYVSSPANPYGNQAIWNFSINGRCPLTKETGGANSTIDKFYLVETSAITSAITSASTNSEVAGAKAVFDAIQAGGGGSYQYYTEDSENKTATIHIEDTDGGTVGELLVDGGSVDMYASMTEEDEDNGSIVETHSDINGNSAGIAMAYEKNIDDAEETHSYLNVEEGLISMEVMTNEDSTTLDVYSNGVTINGERVVTEAAFDYDPVTSALTITFLNA